MKLNQIMAVVSAVMVLLIPAILGDICSMPERVFLTLDGAAILTAVLKHPELL